MALEEAPRVDTREHEFNTVLALVCELMLNPVLVEKLAPVTHLN